MTDKRTSKDQMKNQVTDLLKQKQAGWSPLYVNTIEPKFVNLKFLTDILWYIRD